MSGRYSGNFLPTYSLSKVFTPRAEGVYLINYNRTKQTNTKRGRFLRRRLYLSVPSVERFPRPGEYINAPNAPNEVMP